MAKYWNYQVNKSEAGITLEKLLMDSLQLTRRQISRMKFQPNGLIINNKRGRSTTILQEHDQICIELEPDVRPILTTNQYQLDIVYEDEDMLVINKPSGMVVHPIKGHFEDTLLVQANTYLMHQNILAKLHCVGRLDKDTSGLVVLAKNRIATQKLSLQRKRQILKKTYLAIVSGHIEQDGIINSPLSPDPTCSTKMIIHENGKQAITHYHVLQTLPNATVLSIQIDTGRMHQIRIHLASIGHAILGDILYGDACTATHLCLHAWKLSCKQPFTNQPITLQANYDNIFHDILKGNLD